MYLICVYDDLKENWRKTIMNENFSRFVWNKDIDLIRRLFETKTNRIIFILVSNHLTPSMNRFITKLRCLVLSQVSNHLTPSMNRSITKFRSRVFDPEK